MPDQAHRPEPEGIGSRNFRSSTGFIRYSKRKCKTRDRNAEKPKRQKMKMIRRELLYLAGAAAALPYVPTIAWAQTQTAPKLTQILRKDLESQGETVQETIVSVVDFAPGAAAPWHKHPGAQEVLHVFEGSLVVEVERAAAARLNAGEALIIAADVIHLARNESTSASAKALVVHSRAAKDKPLAVVVKN